MASRLSGRPVIRRDMARETTPSIPDWPAAMRRSLAASYCDLSVPEFVREVAAGRLPSPIKLGRGDRWIRRMLDDAFEALHTPHVEDWLKSLNLNSVKQSADLTGRRARGQPIDPGEATEALAETRAFTIAKLASHWKCSDSKVRTLVQSGQLSSFRVGKLIRITPDAVRAYEASSAR